MYQAASQPSPRRTPTPRRPWVAVILISLLCIAVTLFGVAWAALKGWVPTPVINGVARVFVGRQPDARPWDGDQPVNVLIMGLQIGGASTNPLTDSLMVASYHPRKGTVSLLSIPRDLYVDVPGYGSRRINEAFQLGGPNEAMLTVQQNLGIPVNYYALISYAAFARLIDDVGGVTVDVPRDIDDPTFPAEDEIAFEPFRITKGSHHLDGREALRYARTRHTDTDFGRAERQQQVLMALKGQMMRPANILKLGVILRDARQTVRTSFPFDQAAGLGLKALRAGEMKKAVLEPGNGAVTGFRTASGADVLAPNPTAIKGVVADLFGPSLSDMQTGATVRVENGAGYSGAAGQFVKVLSGMGANVAPPEDADRTDYQQSLVRVYGRDKARVREARLIAGLLGTKLEQPGGEGPADIVVVIGKDFAPYVKFTQTDWQEAIKPK